jgi:hypothetical protein
MSQAAQVNELAIGTDTQIVRIGDGIVFRNTITERPGLTEKQKAVEAALDIAIVVPYPVRKVWPIFSDFNRWMNRFGYVWQGVPADNEDRFVYLGNSGQSNDLKYGADGSKTPYVVRKVIKEQLIYFDGLPRKTPGQDSTYNGGNVMSLREINGQTEIDIYMQHTWYSETMKVEELRAEARSAMYGSVLEFWRDYLIPDLLGLIAA